MIKTLGRSLNAVLALAGLRLTRNVRTTDAVRSRSQDLKVLGSPPPANFDNVALVLEYFTSSRPGAVFVQIGANDGQTSDSVNEFVKRGVLRSVLVEPIHESFLKLERFYAGVPNVLLLEAAIGHKCGSASIFGVKNSGRWADSSWASQLASFDRDHLLRHGIAADEIEERLVECLDLVALQERAGVDHIDVLQIDVEGFDAEVVRMALALKRPPSCICFEFVQFIRNMDKAEVDAFYAELQAKGYYWSHDRINTMAIHQDLIRTGLPQPKG